MHLRLASCGLASLFPLAMVLPITLPVDRRSPISEVPPPTGGLVASFAVSDLRVMALRKR